MTPDNELEFLKHSNWIEQEYSEVAMEDAVVAWEYIKKQEITLRSVLITHMLLMRRLNAKIAGRIRDCDVWIGGSKKTYISKKLIEDDLELLCEAIEASTTRGIILPEISEELTKDLHIDFEQIHPFADGNGRSGRHIYNAHRLKLGLPIHIIHEGDEQYKYYEWFRKEK